MKLGRSRNKISVCNIVHSRNKLNKVAKDNKFQHCSKWNCGVRAIKSGLQLCAFSRAAKQSCKKQQFFFQQCCKWIRGVREIKSRFSTLCVLARTQISVCNFVAGAGIVQWNSEEAIFELLHLQEKQIVALHLQEKLYSQNLGLFQVQHENVLLLQVQQADNLFRTPLLDSYTCNAVAHRDLASSENAQSCKPEFYFSNTPISFAWMLKKICPLQLCCVLVGIMSHIENIGTVSNLKKRGQSRTPT